MASSNIEWTDEVWNPIAGCTKVSRGCANCYAEKMAKRLKAMAQAKLDQGEDPKGLRKYLTVLDDMGRWNGHIEIDEEVLLEPLSWKKHRRVFVNSMSDLFHEGVPFNFIDRVFAVMALVPHVQFLVLTKRPERMAEYLNWDQITKVELVRDRIDAIALAMHRLGATDDAMQSARLPLLNVWLGTSVENQQAADERIPHLLKCPAAVRFVSMEPLLGPVDLTRLHTYIDKRPRPDHDDTIWLNGLVAYWWSMHGSEKSRFDRGIDWVIIGGESGSNARPCNVAWIRSIVEQCKAASVPLFMKQVGRKPMASDADNAAWIKQVRGIQCTGDGTGNFYQHLADPKGGDPAEWPEDLRVREFPTVAARV